MQEINFSDILERLNGIKFPPIDYVVGIGRSGLLPAAMAAYKIGAGLSLIQLNYRDEKNQPCRPQPVLLNSFHIPDGVKDILLVDDVAVSGQTLSTAKTLLRDYRVKTLVLKGQADYVLFPAIQDCVNWPWKKLVSA